MLNLPKPPSKAIIEQEVEKDKVRMGILGLWELLMMAGVVYIQEFLRPARLRLSDAERLLQGSLPSFFAGSAYTALAFVFHKIYRGRRQGYRPWHSLAFACLFSFAGLTLWELIRAAIHPFDTNDVLMTAVGCLLSAVLIIVLYANEFWRPT